MGIFGHSFDRDAANLLQSFALDHGARAAEKVAFQRSLPSCTTP